MLPKKNRISSALFKKLGRPAQSFSTPFFSARLYATDSTNPRGAIVVSTKVASTAVARNRIRRRLYDALGAHLARFPRGAALVLYAKKEALRAPFDKLMRAIERIAIS